MIKLKHIKDIAIFLGYGVITGVVIAGIIISFGLGKPGNAGLIVSGLVLFLLGRSLKAGNKKK